MWPFKKKPEVPEGFEPYQFEPKPDITAYELVTILTTIDIAWFGLSAPLWVHKDENTEGWLRVKRHYRKLEAHERD